MTVERIKDLITQYDELIRYRKQLLDFTLAEEFLSVIPTCIENQETLEAQLREKTSECQHLRMFLKTAHDKITKLYTKCQANNRMTEFLDFANFLSTFRNFDGKKCLASNLVDKNSHQFYDTSLNEYSLEKLGVINIKHELDGQSQSNQITTDKGNRLKTFSIISDEDILTLNSKLEKVYELFDAEILRRKQIERERNDLELLSKKLCCLLFKYQKRNYFLDETMDLNTQISDHQLTITEDISNEIYSAIEYDMFSDKSSLILPPIEFRDDNMSVENFDSNELSGKFEAELIVPDVITNSSICHEIQNHTDISTLPFPIIQPPAQANLQSAISILNIDHDPYSNREFRNSGFLGFNYESTIIESGKADELDFAALDPAENVSSKFSGANEELSNKVIGKSISSNNEFPSSTITPQEAYFDCDFCGKSFLKKASMKMHRRVHMKTDLSYHCKKCGNSYPQKNDGQKLIKCPACDTPESHNSHRDSNMHCGICNRRFAKRSTLIKHLGEAHDGVKSFKCSKCDKCFAKKYQLTTHHSYEHRRKSFECSICNQRFTSLKSQKRHVQAFHEGNALLQCAHCNKKFNFRGNLIIHIHAKHFPLLKNNFKCTICDKAFFSKPRLKIHQLVHTPVKSVKCSMCDSSFKYIHNRTRHEWSVHRIGNKFQCMYCDKVYRIKQSLLHHLQINHAD